ncbi:MAG TPA: nucleotidyltransferase family protein [Stellaceae bacterium]|nr:nucleotidyltransferase family protein [Stellaceae bacterium]
MRRRFGVSLTHRLAAPRERLDSEGDIAAFIARQPPMMRVLRAVAAQRLPDGWVGAGFIRNAVWDALHGVSSPRDHGDVDVIFFDASDVRRERDAHIEGDLAAAYPDVPWSVRNQARMHARNGDAPYADTADALRHWPERCTAIAARAAANGVELLAPFGVGDLVALIVRPTPAFARKMNIYLERLGEKNWQARWPDLKVMEAKDVG